MFSDGKNNRYDLSEKCTISIYAAQILLFFFTISWQTVGVFTDKVLYG